MVTLNLVSKDGKELFKLLDLFAVRHKLLYRLFRSEFEVINTVRSWLLVYPNVS